MTIESTLRLARPGDVLTIEFDGGSRTVTVESVSADGDHICTTSGRVVWGKFRGGLIRVGRGLFNATMAQPAKTITGVTRHAALGFAAVAA